MRILMSCSLLAALMIAGSVPIAPTLSAAIADGGRIRSAYVFQNSENFFADNLAIVALREGCGATDAALTWSGSNSSIDGAIHSNNGLKISGSNNTVTSAVTSGCAADVSGQSNALGTGATQTEPVSSPLDIHPADFTCDFQPPEGNLDQPGPWWEGGASQSGRLLDGVYCTEGRLKLASSGVSGTVTLVATGPNAELALSGSNFDLRPHNSNMLAYSEGITDDAIRISGSGGRWQGTVYAPNGEVSLSGSGGESPGGLIIGNTVTLSGSGWTVSGLPVASVEDVSDKTGTILIHVYACPVGKGEDHTDLDWFTACRPASERLAFEVSPVGSDDGQRGTTDVNGEAIFSRLLPGIYELTAVDSGWCHAKSDRVNANGEVVVRAGEQATVWTFHCTAGKE